MFSNRQSGLRALLHRKAQMIPVHTAWQSEVLGSSQIKLWHSSFQNLSVLICGNYKVPWRRPTWQRRKLNVNWNNATIIHYDLSSNITQMFSVGRCAPQLRSFTSEEFCFSFDSSSDWMGLMKARWRLTPPEERLVFFISPSALIMCVIGLLCCGGSFPAACQRVGNLQRQQEWREWEKMRWGWKGGQKWDKNEVVDQNTTGKPEGYFGNLSLLVDVTLVHIYPNKQTNDLVVLALRPLITSEIP